MSEKKSLFPKNTLVLGRIQCVQPYALEISLPLGQRGLVAVTQLGHFYQQKLKEFAASDKEDPELRPLSQLFHIGQVIRAIVLSHYEGKHAYQLSLNPRLVNQRLPSHLLKKRMTLVAEISSCEDHGWMLDSGISDLRCFLSRKEAPDDVENVFVGSLINVRVLSDVDVLTMSACGGTHMLQMTARSSKLHACSLSKSVPLHFDCFLPGMWLTTSLCQPRKVQQKATNAVAIGNFQGFRIDIPRGHLPSEGLSNENNDVHLCILHVDSTSCRIVASGLPHLQASAEGWCDHLKVTVGQLAQGHVRHVESRRLRLWLDEPLSLPAVVANKDLRDSKRFDKKSGVNDCGVVEKVWNLEDEVKCRIIGFNMIENQVRASMKPSVLQKDYVQMDQLHCGDVLRGKVLRFVREGLLVTLGSGRLRGLIPWLQLTDYALTRERRTKITRLKTFQTGITLRCRILEINPNTNRLILTAKKSLVRSVDPVVHCSEQLQPGQLAHGFIAKITDNGALVCLYGGIKGWVKRSHFALNGRGEADGISFCGQAVRCQVLNYIAEKERLYLSLQLAECATSSCVKIGPADLPQSAKNENIVIGEINRAQVLRQTDNGLVVRFGSMNIEAFLSTVHLSDVAGHRSAILSRAVPGYIFPKVVVIEKCALVQVSAKRSYVQAAQNNELAGVCGLDKLVPGDMLLGTVNNKESYGLFISLPGGARGLVPNNLLSNDKISGRSDDLFIPGCTVFAKLVEFTPERPLRCLLSLRLTDCYHAPRDLPYQLDSLKATLLERVILTREFKGPPLGSLVEVEVCTIDEHQVICWLLPERRIRAIAILPNTLGVVGLAAGRVLPAVTLDLIGFQSGMPKDLAVCLTERVTRCVAERSENRFSRVCPGQVLHAEVLYVEVSGGSWALLHLLEHGAGRLAIAPMRRHWNDYFADSGNRIDQVAVGQRQRVKIHEDMITDSETHLRMILLAAFKSHEPLDSLFLVKEKPQEFQMNEWITVKIVKVLECQLNVAVSGRRGRVFITEMPLCEPGVDGWIRPTSVFSVDQQIYVRVAGFRDTPGYDLPYLECSFNSEQTVETLENGQNVTVYIRGPSSSFQEIQQSQENCGDNYVAKSRMKPRSRTHLHLRHSSQPVFCRRLNMPVGLGTEVQFSRSTAGIALSAVVINALRREVACLPVPSPLCLALIWGCRRGAFISLKLSDNQSNEIHALHLLRRPRLLCDLEDHKFSLTGSLIELQRLPNGQLTQLKGVDLTSVAYSCGYVMRHLSSVDKQEMEVEMLDKNGFVIACRLLLSSNRAALCARLLFPIGRLLNVKIVEEQPSDSSIVCLAGEDAILMENELRKMECASVRPSKRRHQKSLLIQEEGEREIQAENIEEKKKKMEKQHSKDDMVSVAKIVVLKHEKRCQPSLKIRKSGEWDCDDKETDCEEENMDCQTKRPRFAQDSSSLNDAPDNAATLAALEQRIRLEPHVARHWVAFMEWHAAANRLDEARAVCERGLQSITSFQSDYDVQRSLLMVARMRFEAQYGNGPADLSAAVTRALLLETPQVFEAALQLLQNHKELEDNSQNQTINANQVARRFRQVLPRDPAAWLATLDLFFKQGRFEEARRILFQQGLKEVARSHHVRLLLRLAQLEFTYTDASRGQKLFDQLLTAHPRRPDLYLSLARCLLQQQPDSLTEICEATLTRARMAGVSENSLLPLCRLLNVPEIDNCADD